MTLICTFLFLYFHYVLSFLAAAADIWQSDYRRRVGGRAGGRKRRWANQLILELESRNLAGIQPIHSSLFVPNFITKFGSEDLQSQGHVRPPPSETAFPRWCGHPSNCWASCAVKMLSGVVKITRKRRQKCQHRTPVSLAYQYYG